MEALNICANPLVFSVAGLWLLAPVITSTRRLVKWLMAFAILTAFGTVVLGIAITQNEPWADDGSLQLIVGVCLATFTLACGLAGLACRRRYSPWRFFRWLPGWFFIGWFLGVLPFFWGDLNQSYVWSFFLRAVFSGIVLTLVVTVPYFVLAFCHPLFHERLKKLWSVAEAAAPPPAPIETATAPTQGPNPSARP
jgi:hypothetical protein